MKGMESEPPKTDEPVVVNLRLPAELAQWVDALITRGLFKNRSEVIREFSRKYVARQR